MSITRVQGNQVNSTGIVTSQAGTLGSGVAQGNLLIASVATGNNATTITGPSGWTQVTINQPAGTNATIETSIWYLIVDSGHAGGTSWTWTLSASHTVYICIEEWNATGGWPANPVDVSANGDTVGTPVTTTTIDSGTTATTAQAEELWVASLAYKSSAQSESSITAGWTKDLEATLAANNTMTLLYNVTSATGTAQCSYVIGTAEYWAGCVVTFKDNAGVALLGTLAGVGTLAGTLSTSGLTIQAQDTFLTGGRGASGIPTVGTTITGWSPGSDGKNWVAQAATSTFAYDGVNFRGSVTGTTTANIATLNDATGRAWYSSIVSARFKKTASGDGCSVVARFQNSTNYYRAEVIGNNLNITKVVNGTGTTIATTPFTDGGAKFWIKFSCVGFGLNGAYNNLQAKAWLDGNSEPAYQLAVSDAALIQTGLVGVRMKGSVAGDFQYVDSFTATDAPAITPAPAYNVTRDISPGQTYYQGVNPTPLSARVITDLQGWGNGAHLRLQYQWKTAEPLVNFYQLDILDHAVYLCNQAGIRVCLVLQTAPAFRLTRDGYGSNTTLTAARNSGTAYGTLAVAALPAGAYLPHKGQLTFEYGGAHPENVYVWNPGGTYTAGATSIAISTSTASQINWTPGFTHAIGAQIYEATGGPQLPGPSEMATYAAVVAARYNGTKGYGTIEEIEIGNEEWDAQTRFPGNADNGGGVLAPVVSAAYPAIQSAYPTCIIIRSSVRKTPTLALTHITNCETLFWSNLTIATSSPITADAHYYVTTDPTVQTVDTPSVTTEASTILSVAASNGFNNVALLFGEYGYLQWDDGNGTTATVATTALTAGVPITSLTCSALSASMPAGTPITFDYNGGANQEGYASNRVYAKGANALGATTLNITTDPTGATSVAWTPAFTHAIGSTIYGTTHTPILDLNAIAGFTKSMYDALAPYHAHAYYFTLNDTSVVHTTTTPQWADAPRSLVQTISSVYTYAPAYYIIANYVWFPAAPVSGTYTAQIGGNTVFVKQGTLGAQNTIGRSSQANFTVFDRLGATLFQQFQQVQIYDQNGILAFSGYLNPPKIQKPGFQPALETQITCIDQHWLALKRIVAKVYRNQTFGFIVQDLVTNILSQEGVTVGTIAAGPIVPFANFGYCTVSAALDALVAAASSSGIPYYWSIDQNKLLWFVPYTAIVGATVDGTQVDSGRLSGLVP